MTDLPDEIYCKIFSYIFEYKFLVFLKGIKLQLLDYPIIRKTIHYNWKLTFEFLRKTHFWRVKNHTTGVIISADSDDEGNESMSIYEIRFNNSLKETISTIEFYSMYVSNSYKTPEFITDNFKKSKKILENIRIKFK
tara:strand:- start:84 stop:494 length:411 start_codon:yes stop_codon:yes gene_type:complete